MHILVQERASGTTPTTRPIGWHGERGEGGEGL